MDCTYTQSESYKPPDWNCSASGRIHRPFPNFWHPIDAVEEKNPIFGVLWLR
ncbi:hypothetical protein GALMADRAFT_245661 [Galerina marginata CBS 339.88]|uniref:Uncharacterized protein n=1 Tax=Galerina marginata (strain CBS 339.88) TaxID=685588 RepID=A0A067TC90_GALM3|nr:hypothetical protein GALMADRAFT_245661 [Galerina marginata CBS 339.88]